MADVAEPGTVPPIRTTGHGFSPRRAVALRGWPSVQRFFWLLLALYVVKQCIFVFAFRPFSGHDEVAHFSYLQTVATEWRVPVLPELDEWRAAVRQGDGPAVDGFPDELYPYCDYALYWHCEPDKPQWALNPPRMVTYLGDYYPTGYQYGANHPPLYYVVMTPLYWASDGLSPVAQHYLLRLAAIPFGMLTVAFAYGMSRVLFPADAFLAVTVPAVVAFQPQISYEAAMVNNDIVSIALYSAILFLMILGIRDRFPYRVCLLLGTSLGLGLLTKSNSLSAIPLIALAVLLSVGWRQVRAWLVRGSLILLPAAVLAAPWYLFLYRTYGNLDGLDQIAALQSYWNKPAGTFFGMLLSWDFIVMRFKETWGEFGWRRIHLTSTLNWIIALPMLVAFAGLIRYLIVAGVARLTDRDEPSPRLERWQWLGVGMLVLTCIVAYLAIIQFGTRFALTQARYFFPVVNAAALLLLFGLRTLIPRAYHAYAQGAVFASGVLLNLFLFTQYIIPHFISL